MLPYSSIFDYIHQRIHYLVDSENKQNITKEYKDIMQVSQLNDGVFVEVMTNYFYELGLNSVEIKSLEQPLEQVGFKVRATKHSLVVTEVTDDIRLVVGDEITNLSGDSIDYCRKRYTRVLNNEPIQRENWEQILSYQTNMTVDRKGEVYQFDFKHYPIASQPSVKVSAFDNYSIITFQGNVTFEETMEALYELSKVSQLKKSVIYDLRKANFSHLSIAELLLPYFFPLGEKVQIDVSDTVIKIQDNRQKILYKQKIEQLYKESEEMNEQSFYQNLLDQPLGDYEYFEDKNLTLIGLSHFQHIYIMIDKDTSMAAEWLVKKVRKTNIVKVIGRPTKGTDHFLELISEKLDNRFEISYPVKNMNNTNRQEVIYPDVLIEWTKKHAVVDIDLNYIIL